MGIFHQFFFHSIWFWFDIMILDCFRTLRPYINGIRTCFNFFRLNRSFLLFVLRRLWFLNALQYLALIDHFQAYFFIEIITISFGNPSGLWFGDFSILNYTGFDCYHLSMQFRFHVAVNHLQLMLIRLSVRHLFDYSTVASSKSCTVH